jgi:hypothetical protein
LCRSIAIDRWAWSSTCRTISRTPPYFYKSKRFKINEFYQIFQIENVGCWVNTYEIIATGNNVGIIECVPDAISIDQLKKKVFGMSKDIGYAAVNEIRISF